jgi:hypothetical protein
MVDSPIKQLAADPLVRMAIEQIAPDPGRPLPGPPRNRLVTDLDIQALDLRIKRLEALLPRLERIEKSLLFVELIDDDEVALKQACMRVGISAGKVRSHCRSAHLVAKRRQVYQILHELGWSYCRIGRACDRNHAAVMHLLSL